MVRQPIESHSELLSGPIDIVKSPSDRSALLLTRREIEALMRPRDYLDAVEAGFRCLADKTAQAPAPLDIPFSGGAFQT